MQIRPVPPARLALAIGCALVLAALTLFVMSAERPPTLDLRAATWAASHAPRLPTTALLALTQLGASTTVAVLCGVVALVEYVRHRSVAVPVFFSLVLGGEIILVNLIKMGVDRMRPAIDQLAPTSGSSFPSGHTAAAGAVYAALALVVARNRSAPVRRYAAALAAGLAMAVAASRVLLGVHWTTDVLAGLAFGWGWFGVCSIVFVFRDPAVGSPDQTPEAAERQANLAHAAREGEG